MNDSPPNNQKELIDEALLNLMLHEGITHWCLDHVIACLHKSNLLGEFGPGHPGRDSATPRMVPLINSETLACPCQIPAEDPANCRLVAIRESASDKAVYLLASSHWLSVPFIMGIEDGYATRWCCTRSREIYGPGGIFSEIRVGVGEEFQLDPAGFFTACKQPGRLVDDAHKVFALMAILKGGII